MATLEEFLRLYAEATKAGAKPLVDGDARLEPREARRREYGETRLDGTAPGCDFCLCPSVWTVPPKRKATRRAYNVGQPLYFCDACMTALNAGDRELPRHTGAGDAGYAPDWIEGRYQLNLPGARRPTLAEYDRRRPLGAVDRYSFGIYGNSDLGG